VDSKILSPNVGTVNICSFFIVTSESAGVGKRINSFSVIYKLYVNRIVKFEGNTQKKN
jgi:hypothetical protein